MFISAGDVVPSFKGFTLIMPAVSVGNVGQLAVDLLISTLNMPRVGYFHTDCLIPMVGNNPYVTSTEDAARLSISAEVYSHSDLKLAVLQIRTPIIQTKVRSFRKLIVSWIKSSGFLRSVLLSSSYAYQRDDQQLHGTPLRYLLSPSLLKEEGPRVEELGWREMERISVFPEISDSEQRLYIPGGGVTKALYTDCCAEDIPMAVVLIFCSEGDNIPDAFALINHLNDWLHLLEKPTQGSVQWRVPPSWKLLFGSGIPPLLF
ncbi:proteasome assembly chaperone 2 [Pimephales promelas]|uniref:proteasome assembly chaperone 2 n=1 Tax=Pimephales promelas TaxID=90988 RepID=UPI001955DFB6|nr:proteasome assembly chaperone 2 [Pimephales promelas]KAG1947452.1 proteasome assembly chaperone [Pimephales promelas]